MKRFFLVLFFCVSGLYAQEYERIDAMIPMYPSQFDAAEAFSNMLSRDFTTDEDKVRAMYTWLIHNVAYDPSEYKVFNYSFKNYRERNQKEAKTREKIIQRTLQTGKAVCEGYAFVIEKLCNLQGIENFLIRGDTKTHFEDIGRPFRKSHMWNAIKLNGQWHLFDATWGAGKYQGKFIKDPTYFYFMCDPKQLVKSHYPEMEEDTFLTEPTSFATFQQWPLIISPQILPKDVLSPEGGTVFSNSSMNEVYFEIQTASPKEIHYSYGKEKESVVFSVKEGVLNFSVPVQIGPSSLVIYFDEHPVLGYKVK